MPSNFNPDVQDLIRRMLTVDVNQRITIEEIKQHPAFLYGIPSTYVIPTPIQLSSLNEPMDTSCLTKSIIEALQRIGISEEECKQSLEMEGTNQVKEFVDLMLQRTHLDDLPWEKAITELPNRVMSSGFGDAVLSTDGLPMTEETMSFTEVPKSLAYRPVWLPSTPQINFDVTDVYGPSHIPLVDIMADIQKMFIDLSIPFLYPSDMIIIGKYESDTFIRMEAECGDLGTLITVKAIGQTETVTDLISERMNDIMAQPPSFY